MIVITVFTSSWTMIDNGFSGVQMTVSGDGYAGFRTSVAMMGN
jgi:hypothetical protein